ncbi:MAG TPA: hypothetical protein VFN13_13860 [Rudaea sp.]|nr:hypothetical protein [Rudaea sp.]
MEIRPIRNDPRRRKRSDAWYRQPIVWLGTIVFAASIAGCVWLIVVAQRNADPPIAGTGMQVLKMPLSRPPADRAGHKP